MQSSASSSSSIHFLDLPQEVIEKIFSYLSFKNICQLRLVSREVDRICGQMLNSTFQRLQNQMLIRFQNIKKKMPRRESARRQHYLASESDIIETLHMRLTLLQMTFGKHIERKHCCFFPGEILDEVYRILYYIKVTPKLDLPYKVTDELFDLSTMAMEYFKEKIEPNLPELTCFPDLFKFPSGFTPSSSKYLDVDNLVSEVSKDSDTSHDALDTEDLVETIPQSNMVLRKRIRKIKLGMKRYNSQLSMLRQELRTCKRKTTEQQKQISEQQKQMADQQKQMVEYATRMDEYDKKNEEISRKYSTLLQELNKCKTELQYWRCKSPATPPFCTSCGSPVLPQPEELQALINQGVNPNDLDLGPMLELTVEYEEQETPLNGGCDTTAPSTSTCSTSNNFVQQKDIEDVEKSNKSSKRKVEDDNVKEKEKDKEVKKTRRSSKMRCKRMKV